MSGAVDKSKIPSSRLQRKSGWSLETFGNHGQSGDQLQQSLCKLQREEVAWPAWQHAI